jgi:hypothetical protein
MPPLSPRLSKVFRIVAFVFVLALLLVTAYFVTPPGGSFR